MKSDPQVSMLLNTLLKNVIKTALPESIFLNNSSNHYQNIFNQDVKLI